MALDNISYSISDYHIIKCAVTKEIELRSITGQNLLEPLSFYLDFDEFTLLNKPPILDYDKIPGCKVESGRTPNELKVTLDNKAVVTCKRDLDYRLFASIEAKEKKRTAVLFPNGLHGEEVGIEKFFNNSLTGDIRLLVEGGGNFEVIPAKNISTIVHYPMVYYCKNTNKASLSLKYLNCEDKASIYVLYRVHSFTQAGRAAVNLISEGKVTSSCPLFMAELLAQNTSYALQPNNNLVDMDELFITRMSRAERALDIIPKNSSVTRTIHDSVKMISRSMAPVREYIQGVIDKNALTIARNTAKAVELINKDPATKKAKELIGKRVVTKADKALNKKLKSLDAFLSSSKEITGEKMYPIFAGDGIRCCVDVLNYYSKKYPNKNIEPFTFDFPLKTTDSVLSTKLNEIQAIEVQKALIRAEEPIEIDFVPEKYITEEQFILF